jgi:hypothetical protein
MAMRNKIPQAGGHDNLKKEPGVETLKAVVDIMVDS